MNLTQTSIFVRKFLRYALLIVGTYYLLTLLVFPGAVGIIKMLTARKDPPNTVYGQLDQLEFIQKGIKNTDPEFVLNTPDAKLPTNIPDRMKVYKFKPQSYSYLAGKNAIAEAEFLGFTQTDLLSDLKSDVYKWRNSSLGSNLTIEINTREINLSTSLNGKNSYFSPGSINEQSAIQWAKNVLSGIYRFNDTLYPTGTQAVRLGHYTGGRIYETKDLREAQLAIVDFYRSIENFPILGPDPSKGLMRVVVRDPSKEKNIMNNPLLEAYYWEIETASEATYPIIPVKEAWEIVQSGKGVIVSVVSKNANPFETYESTTVESILIDNIYLAYYETPKYQTYLQPIYVFSGKYVTRGNEGGSITLYFPAITGEWTKRQDEQPTQ